MKMYYYNLPLIHSEQNETLIGTNQNLTGENIGLRAELAKQPTFENELKIPTTNLELTGDLNDEVYQHRVRLNCAMNNVTSKTVTIYKITPSGNEGVGLNSGTVATR